MSEFLKQFADLDDFLKNASDVSRLPDYHQAGSVLNDTARYGTEISAETFEASISLMFGKSTLLDLLDTLPKAEPLTAERTRETLKQIAGDAQWQGRIEPDMYPQTLARVICSTLGCQDKVGTFLAQARKRIAYHDQLQAGKVDAT